jgi:hypothetical protein
MPVSFSKQSLTIKTTADMQMLLVTLLLMLMIGFKCYTLIAPKSDTPPQQSKAYANTGPTWNYPSLEVDMLNAIR